VALTALIVSIISAAGGVIALLYARDSARTARRSTEVAEQALQLEFDGMRSAQVTAFLEERRVDKRRDFVLVIENDGPAEARDITVEWVPGPTWSEEPSLVNLHRRQSISHRFFPRTGVELGPCRISWTDDAGRHEITVPLSTR